jgi:ABC-type nitrate/sulfonate/bicarbonate transport system permease component
MIARIAQPVLRFLPVALFLALWQAVSAGGLVDPGFLPSVGSVLAAFVDLAAGGEIAGNLLVSAFRAFTGLVLAIVVGTTLGIAMATFRRIDAFFGPLVATTYSLPKSALVPLFLLWFGIGSVTNILTVFLACLLPILVHAYHGVREVPRVLIWSAETMGATRTTVFFRVLLPGAQYAIYTGIRIALGFSFVLTVSAEMIAATNGIGKLLFMYGENGAYAHMFAALGALVVVAYLADRGLVALIGRLLRWHEQAGAERPA